MKIVVKKGEITEFRTEAVIVPCFEGRRELQGKVKLLDKKSGGLIKQIIGAGDFTGKLFELSVRYTGGIIPAKRIVLVGVGKKADFTTEKLRTICAFLTYYFGGFNEFGII